VKNTFIFYFFSVLFIFTDSLYLEAQSIEKIILDTNASECMKCEGKADGTVFCSHFECPPSPPIKSKKSMESPQEKEIIALLSEVKYSDDLIETVHENGKVLRATSFFIRMIDRKDMSEDEMTMGLADLFTKAGWKGWIPAISIKGLRDKLYLVGIGAAASTQPSSLYMFYDSSYKKIATGENGLIDVIDYRLAGNELGVIFNRVPGSTAFEPGFALLRKNKSEWNIYWTPKGQREWIDVDGETKFLKDDLSIIQVKGTSFALAVQSATKPEKDEVFSEGHIGMHRIFVGIWEKKGDAYIRKTKLPLDTPFYDKLWEMTDFSKSFSFYAPYATVFEFLRRLRNGENTRAAELSSKRIVEKAKELGLSETVDSKGDIIFYDNGFIYSEKEEEKILEKYAPEGQALFFYRSAPPEQYVAILRQITTQPDQIHWQVVEIEKIVSKP